VINKLLIVLRTEHLFYVNIKILIVLYTFFIGAKDLGCADAIFFNVHILKKIYGLEYCHVKIYVLEYGIIYADNKE